MFEGERENVSDVAVCEGVVDVAATAACLHEVLVSEGTELMGHGGLLHSKAVCKFLYACLAVGKCAEQGETAWVGQRLE